MQSNLQNNDIREEERMDNHPPVLKERKEGGGNWYIIIGIIIVIGIGAYYFISKNSDNSLFKLGGGEVKEYSILETNEVDSLKEPKIYSLELLLSESFPVEASLRVKGELLNNCTYLNNESFLQDGNTSYISLTARVEENDDCNDSPIPYEKNIAVNLEGFPLGLYFIDINGKKIEFNLEQNNYIESSSDISK